MMPPQNSVLVSWQFLHSNHTLLTAQKKIWPKLIWDHPKAYKMNYVNTECVTNYVNADDVNKNKQT
jgi:hypothetical protein